MFHFLFPSDPLDPKQVDEIFREQADAIRDLGFGTSLFSVEELQIGNCKLRGPIPQGAIVVYRGWMMEAADYQKLVDFISTRGATPLTSVEAYLRCHHLPNWYPLISELTAETRVFPIDCDLSAELSTLGWDKYFLKEGSETRYFVIDGIPIATSDVIPDPVAECARRISSPFFSVDVAIREDGVERVVEVGDGQVSDLVGWSVSDFSRLWTTKG
jgi:hypothetical protein